MPLRPHECHLRAERICPNTGSHPNIDISNVIEAISTLILSVAVIVSYRQTKLIAEQSKEIALQTKALALSLRRESHQGMIRHVGEYTDTAMARDPALLAWFLDSRGFPLGSQTDNNRNFFLWVRLGIHQSHFFERLEGLVSDEIWGYWCATIDFDVTSSGFDVVWPIVRHTYAASFIEFMSSRIKICGGPTPTIEERQKDGDDPIQNLG